MRRKTPSQLNTREDSDPTPQSKRRKRNQDEKIPEPSSVRTDSESFKIRNLSKGGLKNEASSCCLNAVTFSVHRTGISSHLVDISSIINAENNRTDDAMVAYQSVLRAMPNEEAFSQKKVIVKWNESTTHDDNRPKIGSWDDILLADSLVSELQKYFRNDQSNVPFFTQYYCKFKCIYCNKKVMTKDFAKPFKVIPLLSPRTESRRADRVSASNLLTDMLNTSFRAQCPPPCHGENQAKYHAVPGKISMVAINRRGFTDDDGDAIPKLLTKVTDTPSQRYGDKFLRELVSVVAHKGSVNSGHWLCYSKVDDGGGSWYLNNDQKKVKQTLGHPLKHNRKNETTELLIFKNF